ncbi:MAG TPA: DEAD/DEAH box helicase, partial [Burkholderiales bacterium]|nr:DEAD/DEAH box helicase [Burkholderiales bacterium]
ALVLAPTRELAAQVWEAICEYGKHIPLRSACVYGGVAIEPQMKDLRAGVEILVATPGRLLDLVHQRCANLSTVQILVLDEADRMLDMGFLPDIKRILALLPLQRQNLMFSATFPDDIRKLGDQVLQAPVRIQIAPRYAVAELVTHSAYKIDPLRKRELLGDLIRSRDMRQVLVFTSTKISANRLARQLERDGFNCSALHSDKTQQERTATLAAFKEGKLQVLVATDVASRGLDIEQLPHVINYELPPNSEDYIHRIGRTGRAGVPGEAISLVEPEEQDLLAGIERLLKKKIPIQQLPAEGSRPRERTRERGARAAPRPGPKPTQSIPAQGRPSQVNPSLGRLSQNSPAESTTNGSGQPAPALVSTARSGDAGAAGAPERRRKQVAALFLPPVPAKQD